ncbi:hypothetical protein HPP92_017342 [Vanilla planifolia]|uniref:Uncharacterized protein n=1 Tax=Vanilla planifolia TaxID=51239 RepID=A0A835QKP8_VANPL|nr:hypothetical protein HPP92_017342 [Vanilla planifolia]
MTPLPTFSANPEADFKRDSNGSFLSSTAKIHPQARTQLSFFLSFYINICRYIFLPAFKSHQFFFSVSSERIRPWIETVLLRTRGQTNGTTATTRREEECWGKKKGMEKTKAAAAQV